MTEFFAENLWAAWAVVAVVCMIIELTSGDFYVTCIAIGALVSMVASLFCVPLWVQVALLVVASVGSMLFIRPSLLRLIHNREERASNADALLGREGTVIDDIPAGGYGYVKVDGDEWRATGSEAIASGQRVRIVARESIVVTVVRSEE